MYEKEIEKERIRLIKTLKYCCGVCIALWNIHISVHIASSRFSYMFFQINIISSFMLLYSGNYSFNLFYTHFCRLGSTSAIFNSTMSKHEDFLCPVDGAIMITCNTSVLKQYCSNLEHEISQNVCSLNECFIYNNLDTKPKLKTNRGSVKEPLPFARFNVRMFLGLYRGFIHGLTHCHQCTLMHVSLLWTYKSYKPT